MMNSDYKKYFKNNLENILNIENTEFNNVIFDNCDIGLDNNVLNLPHVKNINFINCQFIFCTLGPTIFENVVFKNTRFEDYGIFRSPFFNQVTIEEKMTSMRINRSGFLTDKDPTTQEKLDKFRNEFYQNVEWALDISRAKLSSFDYEGIPGHLFIRDPDTQFLIKKSHFDSLDLLDKSFKENFDYVTMYLEDFVKSDVPDIVISVPLYRPKKFRQPILEGLQELRRLGFAEKD